jgi:hypothetical protein
VSARVERMAILAVAVGLSLACKAKKSVEAVDPKWQSDLESSMKAFEDRKRYQTLTAATFKEIADADLEQVLVDFVNCKLEKSGKPEREVFDGLSPGFRAVFSTWILEGEVNNGGFNQFFWNSSGEYAADAAAGFDLIGAPAYARLMRRAIAIRDADLAKIQALKKRGTLEAFSESYKNNRLSALDDEFYKLGNSLSAARIKFVRARPGMFVGVCEAG